MTCDNRTDLKAVTIYPTKTDMTCDNTTDEGCVYFPH